MLRTCLICCWNFWSQQLLDMWPSIFREWLWVYDTSTWFQWFLWRQEKRTTTNFQIFYPATIWMKEKIKEINTLNFSCYFLMIRGKKYNTYNDFVIVIALHQTHCFEFTNKSNDNQLKRNFIAQKDINRNQIKFYQIIN